MQRGITLVETLVGMSLLSILIITMSMPLEGVITAATLRSETKLLAGNVRLLLHRARFSESDFEIVLDRSGYRAEAASLHRTFPTGIQAIQPFRTIQLRKEGTASPTTIILQQESHRCSVLVSLRGRVRVIC